METKIKINKDYLFTLWKIKNGNSQYCFVLSKEKEYYETFFYHVIENKITRNFMKYIFLTICLIK